jgi:hypothetical protein
MPLWERLEQRQRMLLRHIRVKPIRLEVARQDRRHPVVHRARQARSAASAHPELVEKRAVDEGVEDVVSGAAGDEF